MCWPGSIRWDSDRTRADAARSHSGRRPTLLLRGNSAIVAPDTSYLAGPAPAEATILYADLDLGRITQGHLALDVDGHYARPDLFQLMVNDRPQPNVRFASDAGTGPPPPDDGPV